jgi:hypothetical protein
VRRIVERRKEVMMVMKRAVERVAVLVLVAWGGSLVGCSRRWDCCVPIMLYHTHTHHHTSHITHHTSSTPSPSSSSRPQPQNIIREKKPTSFTFLFVACPLAQPCLGFFSFVLTQKSIELAYLQHLTYN